MIRSVRYSALLACGVDQRPLRAEGHADISGGAADLRSTEPDPRLPELFTCRLQ